MLLRMLYLLLATHFYATTVSAANSCSALFVTKESSPSKSELINKANSFPFSALKKAVSNQDIKTSRPTLQQIQSQSVFEDRYSSTWRLHPEYWYLRVEMPTNKVIPQPSSAEYFRDILINIQQDHYARASKLKKTTPKKSAKAAFMDSILLKSDEGSLAAYAEIDFIQGQKAVRFLDLNLKTRLGSKMNHDDWWALQDYMIFLTDIYQHRLALTKPQTDMLTDITTNLIDRTTMIHIDDAVVDLKVRSIDKSSGILSVESRNSNEVLPLEVLHGISIRKYMNQPQSVGLVEIGRFGKKNDSPEESLELLKLIVSSTSTRPEVDFVVIEVDKVRRRLWSRYGFEDIRIPEELQKGEFYKSGTDFLMYVPVDKLVSKLFYPDSN